MSELEWDVQVSADESTLRGVVEAMAQRLKNLNVELYSLLFEGEENGACQ